MAKTAALLILICIATWLVGCSEPPVDTTDQSTPQAAVRAFLLVVEIRDADAVERFFVTEDDGQRQYAAAYAQLLRAAERLNDAAVSRFGREESRQLLGSWIPGADESRRVASADIKVDGDSARVTMPDGTQLRLRKVGEKWQIVPSVQEGEADFPEAAAALVRITQAIINTADAVERGQIGSPVDARQQIVQAIER